MKALPWILGILAVAIVAYVVWKKSQPKKITVSVNGHVKEVPVTQLDPNINVKGTD